MSRPATTPETRSVRLLKVGEQVRHVLAEMLARGQVHDAALTAATVSVTEVRMSPDLRLATAYVKPLLGTNEDEVIKALRTHTAFFQKEIAGRLKLRFAPRLRFAGDETFDVAASIDKLLADPRVRRDLGAGDE